jgi:hypothetical protein
MTAKNQAHRCKAQTKSGKPRRAAATAGGLCYFHANPDKASELGRIGGRRKRFSTENADPLAKLESVTAMRDAVLGRSDMGLGGPVSAGQEAQTKANGSSEDRSIS